MTTGADTSSTKTNGLSLPTQYFDLSSTSEVKTRDKLETISERIETQMSQESQITSIHQSPPFQTQLKSSKWKWLKTGSTGLGTNSLPQSIASGIKPLQQHSTNPFNSNLTAEDLQQQTEDNDERRSSIALSLFVPRSAKRDNVKASEEDKDNQVNHN